MEIVAALILEARSCRTSPPAGIPPTPRDRQDHHPSALADRAADPYARNPRKNDQALDHMSASILEFGFKIPVPARSDGEVVDGHLRLKAAHRLGLPEIPVIQAGPGRPHVSLSLWVCRNGGCSRSNFPGTSRRTRRKVQVLHKGFRYDGRQYSSLSAVAAAVTGTRWNGLAFFGIMPTRMTSCSMKKLVMIFRSGLPRFTVVKLIFRAS